MKKRISIYPGTFDPVTYGHLDILTRATALSDLVIVALSDKSSKNTLLPLTERLELMKLVLKKRRFKCPVIVETFSGLLVDYAKEKKAHTLIRGLRAVSDFEYEFQMALMNRHQNYDVETVFLMPDERYVYLSSSLIKEVARLKGRLDAFLPPEVIAKLKTKFLHD